MKRETLYSVLIKGRLTIGSSGGPAIFFFKRDAISYRKELTAEGILECKVVRIALEWEAK